MIRITKIHHVSFLVKDLQVALAFYCDLLNIEKKPNRPAMSFAGAWLKINELQEIHLLELDNPDPTKNRPDHGGRDRHAAFSIEKLAPLQAILEKNDISYTMSHSGRLALFTRDPDGNALEFIEST
ncbi:MAG: VOC family protein [Thiotrichaceae bacterium]